MNEFNMPEKDYMIKSLVVALSSNENLEVRLLITQILTTFLIPISKYSPMNKNIFTEDSKEMMKLIFMYLACEM